MKKNLWNLICEDPFRLFFPLAIFMGSMGISHWLFYALGWTKSYSGFFHSSIQMQAYMTSFVVGFLTTSMPRFASAPHAKTGEILTFFGLIAGIWIFASQGFWIVSELLYIAVLCSLGVFAARRFMKRKGISSPPLEFVWVPIALLHGITGSLLMILTQCHLIPIRLLAVGKPMMEQGFILAVVIGVGGFLAPRLMGLHQPFVSPDAQPSVVARARRQRIKIHIGMGIMLFLTFLLEGLDFKNWAFGLRALIVTSALLWSRAWPRIPRAKDLYVWLIWISMGMVVVGHGSVFLFPRYRVEMLHLFFIGGLSLMTFSVGIMVVMGHSGESEKLRKPLWILWLVVFGILSAVILRVSAAYFPGIYFSLLGAASAFWLAIGISWFVYVLPRLLRIPDVDSYDEFHEEAKQRISIIKSGIK